MRHSSKLGGLDPYTTTTPERSPESLAFEAMWRGLERPGPAHDGLVPLRSAFRPEKASRLLANIALLEVHPGPPVTTRIRLVGSALRDLVDANLTGFDYLDLVPDRDYQAEYLNVCMSHPCAAWAVTPIIYGRGYNALVEITNFPLIDDATGGYLTLIFIIEVGTDGFKNRSIETPVELRRAIAKSFIDIGAGTPAEID